MRAFLIVLSAALAASSCASRARVRELETQLAALEQQSRDRDAAQRGTMMRIEAQLASLMVTMADIAQRSDVVGRLSEIDARLDRLAIQPRPPPRPARPQPDPNLVYAIPIAGDPVRGKPDALVTIVEAYEYACPFCEKSRATMDQIVADYPDDVRIVYKDLVVHPQLATVAAQAACAAHLQGKFLGMDKLLWERGFANRRFELALYEELAAELGLDLDRFRADLAGPCVREVTDDMAELARFGVNATPGFFINGRFLSGAQPYPNFKALIDEELTRARERVKKGTKKKAYYDQHVLKAGLPRLAPPATP